MAQKRLDLLAEISLLEISPDVDLIANQLITIGPMPKKAETDAAHIAIAATNGIDYLLTWNCRHIANAEMQVKIIMWKDEIVEEVRRVREEHAAKFNHDLKAILDDARKSQRESGRKTVSFPPRKPEASRIDERVVEKA